MKKHFVLKTIFATLGVAVILAISAFGIASLFAPAAMMELTASVGLQSISADYAYHEYERSGDIAYLARSFIISADLEHDRTADDRFSTLYGLDSFGDFCTSQDEAIGEVEYVEGYTYRSYVCGLAACVRYRLAKNEEDSANVIGFAASETDGSFPQGNPIIQLAIEAADAKDVRFCTLLLAELESGRYDAASKDYSYIVAMLEEVALA